MNEPDETGWSHIHHCAYRGYIKSLERFVENDPDSLELQTQDDLGSTPFLLAVSSVIQDHRGQPDRTGGYGLYICVFVCGGGEVWREREGGWEGGGIVSEAVDPRRPGQHPVLAGRALRDSGHGDQPDRNGG